MNKIAVIIEREYVSRVRKKSFIIMTLITPLLFAALILVPALIMARPGTDKERKIAVIEDGPSIFRSALPAYQSTEFVFLDDVRLNDIKENFEEAGYYGVLHISPKVAEGVTNAVQLISRKQPPFGLIDYINRSLQQDIERQKLLSYDIENLDEILRSVRTRVSLQTIQIDKAGRAQETHTGISMGMAYIAGFLMYMMVFIFGSQVMRGVIEEKTSRVVEVIVSSVKPMQLMMGKIVGIGMVGLTQFLLWVAFLALFIIIAVNIAMPSELTPAITETMPASIMERVSENSNIIPTTDEAEGIEGLKKAVYEVIGILLSQNWIVFIGLFVFYFLSGYLLYAAVFAAIGSAVDNETETQQFMIPVTIPIMLGLFVMLGTLQNPESQLAFWFSLIPLTSPIVMMARIPFGVPAWEILLSMVIMIITFLAFVWMAAKIYRTGILMYGKKISYMELWKWLRY